MFKQEAHIKTLSSLINSHSKLAKPRVPSVSEWINKLWHICNKIFLCNKNEWTIARTGQVISKALY